MAYDVTSGIIDASTNSIKFGIRSLVYSLGFLFLSVVMGFYLDLTNIVILLAISIAIGATVYYFWTFFQSMVKGLGLREQLIKLDEDITPEHAIEIQKSCNFPFFVCLLVLQKQSPFMRSLFILSILVCFLAVLIVLSACFSVLSVVFLGLFPWILVVLLFSFPLRCCLSIFVFLFIFVRMFVSVLS